MDIVESRRIGEIISGFDPDTEGYAGAMADEIAIGGGAEDEPGVTIPIPGIFDMLEANPTDIVLLHIGTNDRNVDPSSVASTSAKVLTMRTEIDQWEDSANGNQVTVVLALIVDQCVNFPADYENGEPAATDYNNNLVNMINNLDANLVPDKITHVDQHAALSNSTTSQPDIILYENKWHSNEAGYNLMAD